MSAVKTQQSEGTIKIYNHNLNKYKDINIRNPEEVKKVLLEAKTRKGEKLTLNYIKNILSSFTWKIRQEDKEDPILKEYHNIIIQIQEELNKTN